MEVFTELAKHPEDLETLTGRRGLHPRSSRDFLDALAALGFLERHDGKYSNTFHHWGNLTIALMVVGIK